MSASSRVGKLPFAYDGSIFLCYTSLSIVTHLYVVVIELEAGAGGVTTNAVGNKRAKLA